jgi:Fe-S oxidoreductase
MSDSIENARPATACGEAPCPPAGARLETREQLAHWTRSLDCIHCGLCLSACPTYQVTGRENASPRGRIYLMRAVAEGRLEPDASYTQALDECLVCRNCETACPSGVHFGELMEFARDQEKKRVPPRGLSGFVERVAFRHVLPKRRVLGALLAMLRLYQTSGVQTLVRKSGLLRRVAPELAAREALLPRIPSRKERAPLLERYPAHGERRATVGFLTGCVMHPLMPEVHRATIRVLNDQGFDVVVPPAQGCCGALHFHFGHADEGKQLAQTNLRAFLAEPLDAIINNSAGCGAAMKEYPHQLEGEDAKRFSALVRDVSEFLVERGLRLRRALPSHPRAEDLRCTQAAPALDPRRRARPLRRPRVLLWRRRHLQPRAARAGKRHPLAQDRGDREGAARCRRDRQSGLLDAAQERARGGRARDPGKTSRGARALARSRADRELAEMAIRACCTLRTVEAL